jgi:hypothetical protein
MRLGRVVGILLSVAYLSAVAAATAQAVSPDANHPGFFLMLLTLPWSVLVLAALDWVAPNAPNWVGATALVIGALVNVAAPWIYVRWVQRFSRVPS